MRRNGPHKAIGLYAHLTWHTWRRQRSLSEEDAKQVVAAVLEAGSRCRVRVHSQAVLADHVHLVVSFAPDASLSAFIREVKSSSALRINRTRAPGSHLRWCRGFYANTLSRSHVAAARNYVGGQFRRHPDRIPQPRTLPRVG